MRTKTNPLHYAANANRASAGRFHNHSSTMQLRPCQPTCTTLPSSTSSGTLRCPADSALIRCRAAGSASTSSSTRSRLQQFAHDVLNRSLHFLDAGNVIALHDDGKIGQLPPFDLTTVIAQQSDGQHLALASFFQRRDDVARSAAG